MKMSNNSSTSLGFLAAISLLSFNETPQKQNFETVEPLVVNKGSILDSNYSVISPNYSSKISLAKVVDNLKLVEGFKKLQSNWNGYGAKEFDDEYLNSIKDLIQELPVQPEIFPTGRQTVQFEFSLPEDTFLEIEIFNGNAQCLSDINGLEEEKTISLTQINSEINAFFTKSRNK